MRIRHLPADVGLARVICACLLSQCAFQAVQAQITYRIEPVDIDGMFIVTGGSVTTDGTLGPLAPSNILAMSVDVSHQTIMIEDGMVGVLDGSATIDLMNAALSLEGLVEATPTGIRIVRATEAGESNWLAQLSPDNGPGVTWSSAHYDLVFGGYQHTGFNNLTIVYAPPAGTVFGGLPESGLIARVVPEPSAIWLALIAIGAGCSRRRR